MKLMIKSLRMYITMRPVALLGATGQHGKDLLANLTALAFRRAGQVLHQTEADAFPINCAAAPGSLLHAGEYRLRFTFRRNNTALDPQSLVLSQNGDTGDETAVVDAPWTTPS